VYRCTLALRLHSNFVTRICRFTVGEVSLIARLLWSSISTSMAAVVVQLCCKEWHFVCMCVCVCVFFTWHVSWFDQEVRHLTSSILTFFLYLMASRPQKCSVHILWYAMRNLLIYAVIHTRNNVTSGKTIFVITYYVLDRTDGFCVKDCEKGVKFQTLYLRSFFFFPSLTVGRDWNSLISGLLCPYLGIPVLTSSVGWEPYSLANARLILWRHIVLVESDRTFLV
jgi:hypothetical protein